MAESDTGFHNSDNLLRPLEQGVVEKFDKLFGAREKTLKHWIAEQISKKQEFLTRTFPSLIQTGAEHPQLSGGVLYMMGLITEHTHGGSDAINSISRRFAERAQTKGEAKILRPVLSDMHKADQRQSEQENSTTPLSPLKPEHKKILDTEVERTRITKELYNFTQCAVDLKYEKNGTTIDLGKNSSEISILNKDSKTGKSMVFICSSAGNPAGAESFVVEYALKTGNKVYVIGQPDGANGHMSQEFTDAAVADANAPSVDIFRRFKAPTYEPHTQFMKSAITSLVGANEKFDLYSHSGGGIMAKNLLNDPQFSDRVTNAVFLNAAGVATFDTMFPILFRRTTLFKSLWNTIRDLPNIVRYTFEKDRNESAHNAAFWFRDRVTVAIQSSSHYRQTGWDTMRVNGGKIVQYIGGKDIAVGGKQFAKYMNQRLRDTANPPPSPIIVEYDKNGHHLTPFSHPEEVFNRVSGAYMPEAQAST